MVKWHACVWMVMVSAVAVCGDGGWSFARYAPILSRRPFADALSSSLAQEADQDQVVTVAKAPPFVVGLRPCSFVDTARGLRVGFVDNRVQPPETFMLFVGEQREGVLLVDADFGGEAALLRKGNEQYWLGALDDGGAAAAAAAERSPELRTGKPLALSFSERRRLRLEELRARAEARQREEEERAADLPVDELERRLQLYQMDLIRQGKTPLPMIQLTPEMDDQLVAEGVLPAQESYDGNVTP